jgi:hypothetical protein
MDMVTKANGEMASFPALLHSSTGGERPPLAEGGIEDSCGPPFGSPSGHRHLPLKADKTAKEISPTATMLPPAAPTRAAQRTNAQL